MAVSYLVVAVLLVAVCCNTAADAQNDLTISTRASNIVVSTTSDNAQKGSLYVRDVENKTLYVVQLCNENSTITEVPLRPKHSNVLSNPFDITPDNTTLTAQRPLVYTVFRHHAYIASGEDIIILNLKAEDAMYEKLQIGNPPIEVFVHEISGEQYCFVFYENEDRNGYIVRYRKFNNREWGQYGQAVQMTGPNWFNVDKISNIIVFRADDVYFGAPTVYAALANQWHIFVCNMYDGTYFTLITPLPCYNISRLNYNEVKQTVFVECHEGTAYLDFRLQKFYQPLIWKNVVGDTHFTDDGKYGAIVHTSANVSTVTIVDLNITAEPQRYEQTDPDSVFDHFNLTSNDNGSVMNSHFITVSKTEHYFCFMKDIEAGIQCVHVEEGFDTNATVRTLPNSEGVCVHTEDCTMYAHHGLLVAKRCVCEGLECDIVNMIFDMSTFQNRWNVTGIETDFQAFKPIKQNISVAMETTTEPPTTVTTPTLAETTHTTEPTTKPTTESKTTPTVAETTPTTEAVTSPTTNPTTKPPSTKPPTTHHTTKPTTPTTHDDPTHHVTKLEACQTQLENSNREYDMLYNINIGMGVAYCVVLVVCMIALCVTCSRLPSSPPTYIYRNGELNNQILPKNPIPTAVVGDGKTTTGKMTLV